MLFIGTDAAVRLYQKEIVDVGLEILTTNPMWSMKAQAADMLAEVARSAGESLKNAGG